MSPIPVYCGSPRALIARALAHIPYGNFAKRLPTDGRSEQPSLQVVLAAVSLVTVTPTLQTFLHWCMAARCALLKLAPLIVRCARPTESAFARLKKSDRSRCE